MTIVGQCLGAGRKDEAVYYIKKFCVIAEVIIIISCLGSICTDKTNHNPWWYGKSKCRYVLPYGDVDHNCKAACMDHGIHYMDMDLRAAGDVKFSMIVSCMYDVGMQILSLCISDQSYGIRTDGCLDRYVCRLDTSWNYFYVEISQPEVVTA